ncbi:hypothetical protein FGU71_08285 [Erythrobacter insulae]|uniref:DUF2059 domain-containing protein n=1 Tax=Erythrobacter insulae TaxID=2584124 RepID=A0A547PCI8_9SPHN|nr:hypothetical protein [Erythrobacter insulae]TRD11852.1 hypothetical protein FGU71_08285 [Erythrobacter insulae]
MTYHRVRLAMLAIIAALFAALHLPALAQDNDDPHADLYAAIQSGIDQDTILENSMEAIRREYARLPQFIELEAISPGLIKDYVSALRPIFAKTMARSNAAMKLDMIDLFRRELTDAEAAEVAAHYRTDVMQRLLGNISTNFAPDSTLSGIESDAPITEAQVNKDIASAAATGAVQLSGEERGEIARKLLESAALRKFEQLNPKIVAVRTVYENEPLLPDEAAELEALAEAFFAERFAE